MSGGPRGEKPEFAAFAYSQTRSGKTTHYSPVLLRNDIQHVEDPELAMVQGFLFLPDDTHPEGSLNAPHGVHPERLSSLDDVNWTVWPKGLRERLESFTWEDVAKAEARHPSNVLRASASYKRHPISELEATIAYTFVAAVEAFAQAHGRAPEADLIVFRGAVTTAEVTIEVEERP